MRVSIVTIGASALALAAFCCSKTATARQAEPRPPQRILAPAERYDLSPEWALSPDDGERAGSSSGSTVI
jgi:hypothetical protein